MKSVDLAQRVHDICHEAVGNFSPMESEVVEQARSRIMGVGDEQYSEGDNQKFELVAIDKLMEMFEEETVDQINYAVMTLTRLRESPEVALTPHDESYMSNELLDLIGDALNATVRIKIMREYHASA